MSEKLPTIAIIGGTGDLGSGLAVRWAAAGYPIVLIPTFAMKDLRRRYAVSG